MALGRQTDAALLMEELMREVDKRIDDKLAQLAGTEREYAWIIFDPAAATTPPHRYSISRPCRPIDVMAECDTAPSGSFTCDIHRSIDGGATFVSMVQTLTSIASGQKQGAGATFKWEEPETRALVAPTTDGALPLLLRPGDIVKLILSPTNASGAKSLTVQLRVQRVGEHTRGGR
jgi:hypothetical protein